MKLYKQDALVDAANEAEHEGDVDRFARYLVDLERIGVEYGDTPARRSTGVDDWTASGLRQPAALVQALGGGSVVTYGRKAA